MLRECVHCEIEFDLNSPAKKRVGGKINECPDCVEELESETAVRYLGLQPGDGSAGTLNIVACKSNEERAATVAATQSDLNKDAV